jgi:hypothetical protein
MPPPPQPTLADFMDKGPAEEAEATVYWLAINGKGEMLSSKRRLILGRLPPDPGSFVSLRGREMGTTRAEHLDRLNLV